jgi:hypothetical protein
MIQKIRQDYEHQKKSLENQMEVMRSKHKREFDQMMEDNEE